MKIRLLGVIAASLLLLSGFTNASFAGTKNQAHETESRIICCYPDGAGGWHCVIEVQVL